MKIDFSQELKTIEGGTLMRPKQIDKEVRQIPATLKWAAVEALLASGGVDKLSGEEKGRRYELALKVQEAKEAIDLSVDDVSFIKKLCDDHFAPLIVGQTRRLLDGKGD
jgi:hypothetical protein